MIAYARNMAVRWYSIPLLLLIWQAAVASGVVESRLLPGPGAVWTALADETGNGALIYHAGVTISRALTGFALAAVVGSPFAAAMPSIFSGLRIALPVAIIVVVLTEMIGDSIGLGYYITIWSTRFRFANVYAAIIVIGVCGLVLDQALLALRQRHVYWQREEG